MIRKEKIIIGTETEVKDYYLNELKVVKRDTNAEIASSCIEFKPFESQIKLLNNGFGVIFYFRTKRVKKEIKLVMERMFVWIVPEVKNDGGSK